VTLQPLLKRFKLGFSAGSSARSAQRRGPSGAVPSAGRCANCAAGGSGDASHSASTSGHHHHHDLTHKGDARSESKSPIVASWEERRYSVRGDSQGLFGSGSGGRKHGRGYSIQLSPLLSGTQSTHAGASRLSSSGSEEELRREDKLAQQQQREQEQRQREVEARAVPGSGSGTDQKVGATVFREEHIHDGPFRGEGSSAEWEVEVTASPRGHGDEESGLAGYEGRAGNGMLGQGIAVQRDVQVVSMRVDERR